MKMKFLVLTALFLGGHAPPAFSCFLALSATPEWLSFSLHNSLKAPEIFYYNERFIQQIQTVKEDLGYQIHVWIRSAKTGDMKKKVFFALEDNLLSLNRFLECAGSPFEAD